MIGSANLGAVSAALRLGAFTPLALPGSSASPFGYWDADTGVSLSGGNVVSVANQSGASGPMINIAGNIAAPTVWRNGRRAFAGSDGNALGTGPQAGGNIAQPVSYALVARWPMVPGATQVLFRSPTIVPLSRAEGTARGQAGGAFVWTSDTTWAGRSFVAVVRIQGATSKLWIRLQGMGDYSYTATVGTDSLNRNLAWGANAELSYTQAWSLYAASGVYLGAMTDSDAAYLIHGLSSRYAIWF